MNTPTHIACGACLALAVAYATTGKRDTAVRCAAIAAAVLLLGVVSHLLLDLLPHYAWIAYLDWFKPLPHHWLIREAVFGLAVAAPALLMARKVWPFVVLGMAGGLYPDVEKVLAVDFHLPGQFILFDWHSTYLSNRTGGLPRPFLVVMECCLIAACLLAMWRLKRGASNNAPEGIRRPADGSPKPSI
jgi:hypothetical protein